MLRGKFPPSMEESSQILEINSGLRHADWVTAETSAEGLTALLAIL